MAHVRYADSDYSWSWLSTTNESCASECRVQLVSWVRYPETISVQRVNSATLRPPCLSCLSLSYPTNIFRVLVWLQTISLAILGILSSSQKQCSLVSPGGRYKFYSWWFQFVTVLCTGILSLKGRILSRVALVSLFYLLFKVTNTLSFITTQWHSQNYNTWVTLSATLAKHPPISACWKCSLFLVLNQINLNKTLAHLPAPLKLPD